MMTFERTAIVNRILEQQRERDRDSRLRRQILADVQRVGCRKDTKHDRKATSKSQPTPDFRRYVASRTAVSVIRRDAIILPTSSDGQGIPSGNQARSVTAVIATETPVAIRDASGQVFQEVLVANGARIPKWTPFLSKHSHAELESVLGRVVNVRITDRKVQGQLVFSEAADVEPIWIRAREGSLRYVSVGGRRLEWTDIQPGRSATVAGRRWTAGRMPLRVTTSWTMREASLVVFGADEDAFIHQPA